MARVLLQGRLALGLLCCCCWLASAAGAYEADFYNSLFLPSYIQNFKAKVETLGAVLKSHVKELRQVENKKVDLVFIVDSSTSVGSVNFYDELKFVRKMLADFTVDTSTTRVSVITFSSRERVTRQVDYLTSPSAANHKCALLEDEIPRIAYVGGGTYTLGAIQEAKQVLKAARPDAAKAIFLITDGFSNGGDPLPEAAALRAQGVKIFTFGIRNGNVRELFAMASHPKNETCYILDSFEEFEALARRALHEDLHAGTYITQPEVRCQRLCRSPGRCCHEKADCSCGTHTGKYECLCRPGYYGHGVGPFGCQPCPVGTYKNHSGPGDVSVCTPCPDENHVSATNASTDVSQCHCKKGYRASNNSACSVFRCPELEAPQNGYFVNNKCNNVFNAACGLRCQPGYELHGSGLRICQEDGSWSGTATECIMKTCPPIMTPKNGHMICSRDDFTYSTVCRFTCNMGYKLVGSRKRTCLAIAFWTGIATRCREITCPPLTTPRDGAVTPAACTEGEVSFGTTCQMSCQPGYRLYGPYTKQCLPEGSWSPATPHNQCKDETAPYFRCPADIEVEADEEQGEVEVTWEVPVAVDNSGFLPTLSAEPAIIPPAHFPIGVTNVTYTAEDFSKNRAQCSFTVTVIDRVPPRIDRCFSPEAVVSPDRYGNVTWEEPLFTDNSGRTVHVERSHEPGWFPRGRTEVNYTASDDSGNNVTCTLVVRVLPHQCEFPAPPVHGNRTCYEDEEGVHCTLSCHQGFAFVVPPAPEYLCAYDNVWRPQDKMPFPDCAEKKISNDVKQQASLTYSGSISCLESVVLNRIQNDFKVKVSQRVQDLCQDDVVCGVDDVGTTCEEGEDFNKVPILLEGRRRRRRRSLDSMRVKRAPASAKVIFAFKVKGSMNRTGDVSVDRRRQEGMADNVQDILRTLKRDAKEGIFDPVTSGRKMHFQNMAFDPHNQTFGCSEGSILINDVCVNCPVGMFFNVMSEECQSCPVGSYQTQEGSLTCMECPGNSSTLANRSRSLQECRARCLPGSFSANGLEPCETCEVGYFQPEYAQSECLPCPRGKSTLRRGARRKSTCRAVCKAGYVSMTGLAPCLPCPRGSYQPDPGQILCLKCPYGGQTPQPASVSLSDCEGSWEMQGDDAGGGQLQQLLADTCFANPCQNGATCVPDFFTFTCQCAPGFSGTFCEQRQDFCETSPCLNGGTCRNQRSDFFCTCPPGFEGKKCDVDVDECQSQPCQNGGVCVDGPNSFSCNCPSGFQGATCEVNTDDCAGAPCRNGGTCEDGVSSYTCRCTPGYGGENCEINEDECRSNPCLNNGVCRDAINSFRCECRAGYTGARCEQDIDECGSGPCQNGASCEDGVNTYRCQCPTGFLGDRCERGINVNYQLDFPSSGTTNYAALRLPDSSLSDISVSFWMRTDDIGNYGTPFSYAVPGVENALTLTDPNGLVLYVNDERKVTDIPTNDGRWHHVVVTWSSNRGLWKIYVDGLLNDSDFDLSTGRPVPGGGVFVVGQEQDSVGGGFSASESFVGSLTHLNVWDSELSLQQIEAMRTNCTELLGNVLAWPDVAAHLHGTLSDAPSTFCQDCPEPESPQYGRREFTGLRPGSWVTYSCLRGFVVAGRERFQCLSSGNWEEAFPHCERVSCGYPGSFRNGRVQATRYTFDNRARYICNRGYRLVGPETRYCNEFGVWEGDNPECVEITCELPPLSENTVVSNPLPKYLPGALVEFECRPGNRLRTAHNSVLCQADGTWDKSVPTCDSQTCGQPPSIRDGAHEASGTEFNVGTLVQYACDYGFTFSQTVANTQGRLTCLPSGEWEQDLPQCEVYTCPSIPVVAHADVFGSEVTFLSTVQFECHAGYELRGPDLIECVEGGVWNDAPPSCQPVSCGEPRPLANGRALGGDFVFGSYVSYECDPGHTLVGELRRRCTEDGTWSGAEPLCKPIVCGIPENTDNGRLSTPGITFRSVVTYECFEGFSMEGESTRTCMENGRWEPGPPTCVPAFCSPPPDIADGYMYRDNPDSPYSIGTEVKYFCNVGYELTTSDNTITCSGTGQWEGALPGCVLFECPQLQAPDHGAVSVSGLTFTSVASYSCEAGWELEGAAQRVCNVDQTWTDEAPTCRRSQCPAPPALLHGSLDFKDLFIGSIVRYTCDPGYRLVGVEVRRCQGDLTLSDQSPTCELITCPELAQPEHGEAVYSETRVGAAAAYLCDEGFQLEGALERRCQTSGLWSGAEPRCVRVRCPTPADVIEHGRMIGDDFTYEASVRYQCDEGYRLEGSASRLCQASGAWDAAEPRCLPVQCPVPLLPDGYLSSFAREYGATVTFSCRDNFRLEGAAERTCQADGSWSGVQTSCVRIVCSELSAPEHGSFRLLEDERLARFSCDVGFRLEGAGQLRCGDDSRWDLAPPSCVRATCEDLGQSPLDNGQVRTSDANYFASVATYSCLEGFTLQGSQRRTCDLVEGEYRWEGEAPACLIVSCGPPDPFPDGQIQGSVFTFGSVITYTCSPGRRLIGQHRRSCQADGQWSDMAPDCPLVVCPPLEAPGNGEVFVSDFRYGGRANYSCRQGYELSGRASRACRVDGQWEHVQPDCVLSSCGEPEAVDHARLEGDVFTPGRIVRYVCLPGFRLVGEDTRMCLPSKMWTGSPPRCERISCPDVPQLEHGSVQGSSFLYNDTVSFSCEEGFELLGDRSQTCQADGSWSGVYPMCDRVSCDVIPSIPNAVPGLGLGMSFQDVLTFTCNPGYTLQGDSSVTCQADGMWSPAAFTCDIVHCPPITPADVPHADISGNTTFDSSVSVQCQEGYRLEGAASLRCTEAGTWDDVFPSCDLVTCPRPVAPDSGSADFDSATYAGVVTYACSEGYELVGVARQTCTQEGAWSDLPPTCRRVSCPAPPSAIPNGEVVDRQARYQFQDTVTFRCAERHQLVGEATLRCLASGQWSAPPPSCLKVLCPAPAQLQNGLVSGTEDVLDYSCEEGYSLAGPAQRRCLGTGQWEGDPPTCQPVPCPAPDPLAHGAVQGDVFTFGNAVSFACDPGFVLNGSDVRTCLADGTWDGVEPRCDRILCAPPGQLANGQIAGDSLYFQERLQYSCDYGYLLSGSSERVCQADGSWSGTEPVCNQIVCPPPPQTDHGSYNASSDGAYGVGSHVVYACEEGFRPDGPTLLQCQLQGAEPVWSQLEPLCLQIVCPDVTPPEHGRVQGSGTEYGQTLTFQCQPGYRLEGQATARCQEDGQWSSAPPSCVSIVCPDPSAPANGKLQLVESYPGEKAGRDVTGYVVGDELLYTCHVGFDLDGSPESRCLETGSWSAPAPLCVGVQCGPVPDVPLAIPMVDDDSYGSTAHYVCQEGYELLGNNEIRCSESGTWQGALPTCREMVCAPPPIIPFATVTVSGRRQKTARYMCNEGYRLLGSPLASCRGRGWTYDNDVRCEAVDCGPPPSIQHGSVSGVGTDFNSTRDYVCHPGYELSPPLARVRCAEDGAWQQREEGQEAARCTPVSCGPPLTDALVVGDDFTFGSTVSFACLPGHDLLGPASATCGESGSWGGFLPSCARKSCGPFQLSTNVHVVLGDPVSATRYGDLLVLQCDPGYTLIGQSNVTCREDGQWDAASPVCQPISCGPPLTDAIVLGDDYTYGASVSFACRPGHDLIGPATVTCGADGSWSDFFPSCTRKSCGALTLPEHMQAVRGDPVQGVRYGDSLELVCDLGFALVGQVNLTCRENGQWSADLPGCEPVIEIQQVCLAEVGVAHALPMPSTFVAGDWSQVQCERGFTSSGDMTSLCQEDLTWTVPTGHCRRVSCGKPVMRDMVNIWMFGRSFLYGDSVRYRCRPGLTPLRNPPVVTCQASGQWDGELECSSRCKFQCLNGGMCVGFNKCKCRAGYTGVRCQLPVCVLPCLHGGSCSAPYTCRCQPGYEGSRCQRPVCSVPCANGGICMLPNRCRCFNGFKPPFCQSREVQDIVLTS